jgi:hypothetical protein
MLSTTRIPPTRSRILSNHSTSIFIRNNRTSKLPTAQISIPHLTWRICTANHNPPGNSPVAA